MKFPNLFFELNEDKLYKWLSDPSETEGWDYDFKEKLPHRNDKNNKLHLVATFCAFANTRGGFLIYGIDKNKSAEGISLDNEFRKKLNDLVGKYIKPPLQNKWDIINQFELTSKNPGKYIYIVSVPESLIYHKPHVCVYEDDRRIYIRQNSSNISLDDGRDVRSWFFDSSFSPYCFDALDKVFEDMKAIGFKGDYIETLFLLELKQYLKTRGEKEASFLSILAILNSVFEKIKVIKGKNESEKNTRWDELVMNSNNVGKDKLIISVPYNKIPIIIDSIDKCSAGTAKIEFPPEFRQFLQERLTVKPK